MDATVWGDGSSGVWLVREGVWFAWFCLWVLADVVLTTPDSLTMHVRICNLSKIEFTTPAPPKIGGEIGSDRLDWGFGSDRFGRLLRVLYSCFTAHSDSSPCLRRGGRGSAELALVCRSRKVPSEHIPAQHCMPLGAIASGFWFFGESREDHGEGMAGDLNREFGF